MNKKDLKQAEEAQTRLRDRALEMFEKKNKAHIMKNHKELEKIKKYLKEK